MFKFRTMIGSVSLKFISLIILSVIVEIIPIQMHTTNMERMKRNGIEGSQLNKCLSVSDRSEVGVCFGKEMLSRLNDYEETDSFSLATGVSFVRDEKMPRDIGSFLDKDPMDFRSIIEEASNLISKRSLRWDLGKFYPGLIMKIGPTLANGLLEFVIDPRIKDRSYQQGELTTGRLLARNLLLPLLLGIKFQITTLLPLLLGLLLLASKKAFLLSKVALFAVTLFSHRESSSGQESFLENLLHPTESPHEEPSHEHEDHHHHHHGHSGYYHGHHHGEHEDHHHYKEKADLLEPTISPISPGELRDRLERLFITKKDAIDDPRKETKVINSRNYVWTPMSGG